MGYRALVSIFVVVLTFAGYIPYVRDIFLGKTKPHAFTWLTVTITAFVAYALQVLGGAGIGALPMLAVAAICLLVFVLSLWRGTKDVTSADVICLVLSMVALFFWLVIKQPVWSVILITLSEILGYLPTIRKSWNEPYSETLSLYQISMFRHGLSILGLVKVNILTALYPAAWALTNLAITVMLIARRRQVGRRTN